nr:N-acetyltransferase [Phytoactinopolyspora mesophila]
MIRREGPADADLIRSLHTAAFAKFAEPGRVPVEAGLVDELRADPGWIPALSLVAVEHGSEQIVGHVVCTRATVGSAPVLGLGPLGVLPEYQKRGVGAALMYAVLGAADALDETVVVLLGHTDYYPRFGFRPAGGYGIVAPDPRWGEHFQARTLSAYHPGIRGQFTYAEPFRSL